MQWASGWAWPRPCRTSRSRRMLFSVTEPGNVFVSAPHTSSLDCMAKLGVPTSDVNLEVGSDVVVVAVKSGVVAAVLREITPHLRKDALVVSVAAGIPLASRSRSFPASASCASCLNNTSCLLSERATRFSMRPLATDVERDTVHALDLAVIVMETLLDGLTGVRGM